MAIAPSAVTMSAPVIAAIDLGPLSARVLFHAAAFARLLQVPLKVLQGMEIRDVTVRSIDRVEYFRPAKTY